MQFAALDPAAITRLSNDVCACKAAKLMYANLKREIRSLDLVVGEMPMC